MGSKRTTKKLPKVVSKTSSINRHDSSNKGCLRGFPGGPVVKNLPSNAGDTGSIFGQGTKIPHAAGQTKPAGHN